MSSTVAVSGRLTVFEIAPEMNGCTAPIILMWPMCEIARSPTATSNTGRCSSARSGRADDRAVLVDVRDDLLDLLVGVAERLERERHGPVDDRHLTAADELLELDEREVRLDAGRVAVHQEARSCPSARAPSPARCGSRAPRRRRPPRPTSCAPPRAAPCRRRPRRRSRRPRRGASASPRCAPRGSPRSDRTAPSPPRSAPSRGTRGRSSAP